MGDCFDMGVAAGWVVPAFSFLLHLTSTVYSVFCIVAFLSILRYGISVLARPH